MNKQKYVKTDVKKNKWLKEIHQKQCYEYNFKENHLYVQMYLFSFIYYHVNWYCKRAVM